MKVVKRDGREEVYNGIKVIKAAESALLESGHTEEEAYRIACAVNGVVANNLPTDQCTISVKNIHILVEDALMDMGLKCAAREYIQYRQTRDNNREAGGKLLADISGFLDRTCDEFTKENANKPTNHVHTHRDLLAGILSKHLASTQILPDRVSEEHNKGFIHVHDLDYLISPLTNCCLVNYPDMLENGFNIGNAHVSKPKSIGVATTILSQISSAVASAQYGGQTMSHIDHYLAQYAEATYEKNLKFCQEHWLPDAETVAMQMTDKDVFDSMQTLLYQINTLTSVNGQTPFITLSLGLDTSVFGRMITKNYLKVHKMGLGEERITPVFPKVLFFLEEGVNMSPGDPNYDLKRLALECSAERIYPDFVSVPLNRKVTGSTDGKVTSMGCRSFLSKYNDLETGEEKYLGRFNLGVVSLNLPMIAAKAKTEGVDFFAVLDEYLDLAYEAHLVRVNRLKGTKAGQNPIMWCEGALARLDPEESIDKLFYDGYASISIGYIGVYETCQILGREGDKALALGILQHMRDACERYKKESRLAFSLYGTPSESLCYKAATCLDREYPEVLKHEHEYLTNSFHQPVWINSSPFDKWEYEEGFAMISSGGNIGYVETPNLKNNLDALEALVDFGYKHIMYFGINQPVDKCLKCGFSGEFSATAKGFVCPECGNHEEGTISVIRRVSGYLSSPNSRPYNKGKQAEVIERVKHYGSCGC